MALCSCDMFWCRDDAHKDGRCARPAAANGSRCSQCEGQTTGPTRVSMPNAAQRLRAASSVPTVLEGPARGLGARAPPQITSPVAIASGQRDRWLAPLSGEWQKLPKGKKGGREGRYQLAGYLVSPAFEAYGEAGQEYHLVLCKGDIRLLDEEGKSAGFQQNFSAVADKDGLIVFPQPQLKRISELKRFFAECEERRAGSKLPAQKRSRTRKGPKQEHFSFWVCARTVPMGNEPAVEIHVTDPWRFELKTKIKQINDKPYLTWRSGDTVKHNTMVLAKNGARVSEDTAGDDMTEPLLNRQKSASSSAGSSAVAPATIRSPHTFGTDTIHFQLAGDIRNPLQVDPTTEVRFSALVEAIVGSLVAIGRCSMREESLDVEYEQTLASNLKEGLANPAQTQLFFGGQLLTPEDMTPLTSIIERARVVVIVAAEAVVKDFDILRGKRDPLDDHPVTGYEPLFLDEDSFDGTVPMASNASVELVHVKEEERDLPDVIIELAGVKQEHAEEKVCVKKEEEDRSLRQDVALLQEFFLRLPAQRLGSIVQRVGSTNTRGVVVEANESDPCEVHVLFEEEDEVESNLKVGENLLLVELSFSE